MQNTLGRVLRLRRKELGYSQRDVAAKTGLNYTYISKIENDRTEYPPSEEVLRAIAQCLEMDAENLLRIAGRLTEEEEQIIHNLARQYPGDFIDFLKTLNRDAEFAQKIMSLV